MKVFITGATGYIGFNVALALRHAGNTVWVKFHLLFPKGTLLDFAHGLAPRIEEQLQHELGVKTEVISHLETLNDHQAAHLRRHYEHFSNQACKRRPLRPVWMAPPNVDTPLLRRYDGTESFP